MMIYSTNASEKIKDNYTMISNIHWQTAVRHDDKTSEL